MKSLVDKAEPAKRVKRDRLHNPTLSNFLVKEAKKWSGPSVGSIDEQIVRKMNRIAETEKAVPNEMYKLQMAKTHAHVRCQINGCKFDLVFIKSDGQYSLKRKNCVTHCREFHHKQHSLA